MNSDRVTARGVAGEIGWFGARRLARLAAATVRCDAARERALRPRRWWESDANVERRQQAWVQARRDRDRAERRVPRRVLALSEGGLPEIVDVPHVADDPRS